MPAAEFGAVCFGADRDWKVLMGKGPSHASVVSAFILQCVAFHRILASFSGLCSVVCIGIEVAHQFMMLPTQAPMLDSLLVSVELCFLV